MRGGLQVPALPAGSPQEAKAKSKVQGEVDVHGEKHAGNLPRPRLGRRERPVSAPSLRPLTPDPCPRAKPAHPSDSYTRRPGIPHRATGSAQRSSARSRRGQYPDSGAAAAATAASPLPQRQLRQPLHPPTPVTQPRKPRPTTPNHGPLANREAAMKFDRVIRTSLTVLTSLLPRRGRGEEGPLLSPPYSLNQRESRVFPLEKRQRYDDFDWSSLRRRSQGRPSRS